MYPYRDDARALAAAVGQTSDAENIAPYDGRDALHSDALHAPRCLRVC